MITVPTHKGHKSPFKHSMTIYVFTSGPVKSLHVQFHNRKNLVKGLKWPLQNRHQYRSAARVTLCCCKIGWKGVFAGVGWRCSKDATCICIVLKLLPKTLGFSTWFKCRPGLWCESGLSSQCEHWNDPGF
jgi:hypothetical protein